MLLKTLLGNNRCFSVTVKFSVSRTANKKVKYQYLGGEMVRSS